ncbi:MAG: type I-C CRISPR-associated protein Cas7/Csd2 [Candidatus Hydrogenedentes bacterium]|nr:type I-C CRISPR-associated protein Cas7/Csd2 [Candidatus Hydrogenedentota bacterium]
MNNRYDFVYLFDCKDGNPNGDPDAANAPRIDPQDMRGLVSDVCLKRKVRDFVALAKAGSERHQIYVQHHGVLEAVHKAAYDALKLNAVEDAAAEDGPSGDESEVAAKGKGKAKRQPPSDVRKARQWVCERYFDVRTFGAVMSTKLYNAGQVRGPVQLSFSRSIEPILPLDLSITRVAVANEKEKLAKDTTMGRKNLIPYGLYRCHGFISAHLANETGFSEEDLALFWQALTQMFDHDRSASRGTMAPQKLAVFKHATALGNAPAHKLFERVSVVRRPSVDVARCFSDYEVRVKKNDLPSGVELLELL